MRLLLWVCLGGAAGTAARYLMSGWAVRALGPTFPYGTLMVNVIGSFFISILMYLGLSTKLLRPELRVILTSGVMGGFTTYSSFNYETLRLLEQGAWALALANLLGTVVACLISGIAGQALARWMCQ